MARADFCSKELVELVFPDLKSLISIHVQLNNEMKAKMKEDKDVVSIKDVANILIRRVRPLRLSLSASTISIFMNVSC